MTTDVLTNIKTEMESRGLGSHPCFAAMQAAAAKHADSELVNGTLKDCVVGSFVMGWAACLQHLQSGAKP